MNRLCGTLFFLFYTITICANENIAIFHSDSGVIEGDVSGISVLDTFPFNSYNIYHVEGQGDFYIDNLHDIIKDRLRRGEVWEKALLDLSRQYVQKGSTVVDIGAHIGTHTIPLSSMVGESGSVISFEPQKKLFSEQVMNLILNDVHNVTLYRCAVGDTFKTIEMFPSTWGNEGGTPIGAGGDKAEMITLDSLQLNDVSFIKIDVENFEDHVLNGAVETLARNRPFILIEIQGWRTYNSDKDREKTLQLLSNLGYEVHWLGGDDWFALPKRKIFK